jgi:hypothetical protein
MQMSQLRLLQMPVRRRLLRQRPRVPLNEWWKMPEGGDERANDDNDEKNKNILMTYSE